MHPSPLKLAHLLSTLTQATTRVSIATGKPEVSTASAAGIYIMHPEESAVVLRIDAALLRALTTVLIGDDDNDDSLADCAREILNVLSGALHAKGRAILSRVITDPAQADAATRVAAARATRATHLNLSIDNEHHGAMSIFVVNA